MTIASTTEKRIVALDGLRGFMTILVVISHFFAELPHGFSALAFGWVAVTTFFVLSGYLVGKLILEKGGRANFYRVFYIRRFCRTLPIYVCCVLLSYILFSFFSNRDWIDANTLFPLWSYLTFTQNFFIPLTHSMGAHWLAPTWTLTVEEHFYLAAPVLIVFTPRRFLVILLTGLIALSLILRSSAFLNGFPSEMFVRVMLPGLLDVIVTGVLAAWVMTRPTISWQRIDPWLRVLPLLFLIAGIGIKLLGPEANWPLIFEPFLVSCAAACWILALVRGVPEAKRFENKFLRFFGDISYAVYLTHLPILGLMHGIFLHARPDIETIPQCIVSMVSLPICTLVAWLLTRYIEQPITRYGRSWKWSEATRRAHH